jgi:trans-aconitate methyltransferase
MISSPQHVINTLVNNLNLSEHSIFYDLGCGSGKVLLSIAKKYPQAKCIGIDNSPFSYLYTKIRFINMRNVSIFKNNIHNVNLSNATHIYCWLFTDALDKLLPKLQEQLKPNVKLYSLDFCFSNKNPTAVIDLGKNHKFGHILYIYNF